MDILLLCTKNLKILFNSLYVVSNNGRRKYRDPYKNPTESYLIVCKENMNKIIGVIISIMLLAVGFSGCVNQAGDENEERTQLLTIGIGEDPHGFFPWIDSYDTNTLGVNFNIFNPLVAFDNSFKLFPKLAKSWNNPDNCTWRFFLRDDVKFHNGYNFTAADVKYTIDYIMANKSYVLRDLLTEIKEVRVVDEYTVDFETYQPFPILLNKLTNIPVMSQRYQQETTEKWPIGTGAYKLQEYAPGDHITLASFDEYTLGQPVIENVIFKVIQRSEDRRDALIAKEIDIMDHVPERYVQDILNTSGITVKKFSNPTVWYLGFDFRETNSSSFPGTKNPLSDVRVRKALYHAIDVDRVINILGLAAEPASQFLSPLIFGYNPEIKRLPYDLNISEQLLKDAGYENGFNVTLVCPENYVLQLEISEEIARQLSQIININVSLISSEEEYYTDLFMGNYALYFIGWIPATGDGGEIFDYLLRSENHPLGRGAYNYGHYSNQTVDEITSEISSIMDQKTRRNLMYSGFRAAMDDIACIPMYISVCNIAYPDYLEWDPRSDLSVLVEEISVI
jgi:peptide/nickel transport system substrate-binding protein